MLIKNTPSPSQAAFDATVDKYLKRNYLVNLTLEFGTLEDRARRIAVSNIAATSTRGTTPLFQRGRVCELPNLLRDS